MDISSKVKEGHEKLSTAALNFLEYVKETPGCCNRSRFREIQWRDPLLPLVLQPWPFFISREIRSVFKESSTKIFALIRSIPRRLFANNTIKMGRYFDLPVEMLEQSLYGVDDEHIGNLIGRGDFVFSPSGLKCLEFNIASNFGGWQISLWQPMYLQNPIISGFIKKNHLKITNKNLIYIYFDHFIDAALKAFPNDDEINIVLQTGGGFKEEYTLSIEKHSNWIYKDALKSKRQVKPLKGEVIFASFNELNLKGEHLYYRDKRIHVVIEYVKQNISPEILILFKLRKVLLYDGPVNFLMNNKLHLALLSEHQDSDLFTAEEQEIIKKYIPWTRKLHYGTTTYRAEPVQLEDFVISHRKKLIIKPAKGTAGEDVHLGYNTPGSRWRELISAILKEKRAWVVQERVESYPFLFQAGENGYGEYDAVWGMFVFGSHYGGAWGRLLPRYDEKGVISSHQGAQEAIVLEVDR